ncbi:MAG: EamA family transporter [Alistipes indistinctus]
MRSREFGNLFMFISVLAAATNTIFIKPSLMRYGTILVTGWYYIIGLVISAPFFAKGLMHYDFASLPVAGGLEIAYILVLGTVLPNYLLYYGTEKLTSVHTGLYSYLQPISATILALLRRQVELDYNNLIAAGLILIGIVLVVITYEKYKFPVPKI